MNTRLSRDGLLLGALAALAALGPERATSADGELNPMPANERSETQADGKSTTLAFMGDTMLGRLVSEAIPDKPPACFWGDTLGLVRSADLALLNLETSITTRETRWSEWRKAFYYRAVPAAVEVLKTAGIDYVTLANNHVLDFSEPGLEDTLTYLDRAAIPHSGAGMTPEQATAPIALRAGGLSFGVFSFADHYEEWDAAERSAGIFFVDVPPSDEQWRRVAAIIDNLKSERDFVILSVHWGPNMVEFPSDERRKFARRLIDAGVDLIHGHSAHVFQGVEIYRGKVILYDTGEFIDDYAVDPDLRNDLSFLFLVELNGPRAKKIELIPVAIDRMQVNTATGKDRKRAFALFQKRMQPFETSYAVVDDRIVIRVSE